MWLQPSTKCKTTVDEPKFRRWTVPCPPTLTPPLCVQCVWQYERLIMQIHHLYKHYCFTRQQVQTEQNVVDHDISPRTSPKWPIKQCRSARKTLPTQYSLVLTAIHVNWAFIEPVEKSLQACSIWHQRSVYKFDWTDCCFGPKRESSFFFR